MPHREFYFIATTTYKLTIFFKEIYILFKIYIHGHSFSIYQVLRIAECSIRDTLEETKHFFIYNNTDVLVLYTFCVRNDIASTGKTLIIWHNIGWERFRERKSYLYRWPKNVKLILFFEFNGGHMCVTTVVDMIWLLVSCTSA